MSEKKSSPGYSWQTGFIYVFNLIVGAALLALPKAFAEAGWILSLILLNVLAAFSYLTVTYVIEVMSIANAVIRQNAKEAAEKPKTEAVKYDNPAFEKDAIANDADKKIEVPSGNKVEPVVVNYESVTKNVVIEAPAEDFYDITEKVELGEMAGLFFNKAGVILYYLSISLYLYGGMSVYSAAIAKSLTTVVCEDTKCFQENVTSPCGRYSNVSIINMYRLSLAGIVIFIFPFVFFNISNTKILQMFTTTYRWLSMFIMITLAFLRITHEENRPSVKLFDINELPNLFGVAVYSFMCQHSIPAVVTPVTNKSRVKLFVIFDFVFIVILYSTVSLTATFAFGDEELLDLYSLNFISPVVCKYILQLYPVFTLSANLPILGIVMRENVCKLVLPNVNKKYNGFFVRRILFPLISIIPPICVAYSTYDVGMLVGYSGTYAGAIIQYVIPSLLVFCARRQITKTVGVYENRFSSPFRHTAWIFVVLGWYVVCLVFVTYNKITSH